MSDVILRAKFEEVFVQDMKDLIAQAQHPETGWNVVAIILFERYVGLVFGHVIEGSRFLATDPDHKIASQQYPTLLLSAVGALNLEVSHETDSDGTKWLFFKPRGSALKAAEFMRTIQYQKFVANREV